MDFSSIPRALESLHRRQPSLSNDILNISNDLLSYIHTINSNSNNSSNNSSSIGNNTTSITSTNTTNTSTITTKNDYNNNNPLLFYDLLKQLITISTETERWESLAVGIYIITEILIVQAPVTQSVSSSSSSLPSLPNGLSSLTINDSRNTTSSSFVSSPVNTGMNINPVYMDGPRVPITTSDAMVGVATEGIVPSLSTTKPFHTHAIPTTTDTTTTTMTTFPVATTSNTNRNNTNSLQYKLRIILDEHNEILIELIYMLHTICIQNFEHVEPRLRTLVAKAIGAYCTQIKLFMSSSNVTTTVTTKSTPPPSTTPIATTAEPTPEDSTTADSNPNEDNKNTNLVPLLHEMYNTLIQSIGNHIKVGRNNNTNTNNESTTPNDTSTDTTTTTTTTNTTAIDDTTGWRAIETNWFCLASFIYALSDQYIYLFPISDILYDYIKYSAIQHINRHVRAAAIQTYEQLINVITVSILKNNNNDTTTLKLLCSDPTSHFRILLIQILKAGYEDNWCQVRMTTSVLCRTWFQSLILLHIPIDDEPIMISTLLPRMCLHRFYFAPGVKLYSHETWKIIFNTPNALPVVTSIIPKENGSCNSSIGLQLVVKNISAIIRYYIQMCDADNHSLREAACQAISELIIKVGMNEEYKSVLVSHNNYIQLLINAIVMCFHDESWPVRDEACLTCGILCKAFPKECQFEFNRTFWNRFTEQITDQIWSVRENAAIAIGDIIIAYGDEILPKIKALIQKLLPSAKEQPSMSMTEYKAQQQELNNMKHLPTNNESIATSQHKAGVGWLGCSDCIITRPKAPWEATDGCIYLIREYIVRHCPNDNTTTSLSDNELIPLCTELVDICRLRHFPQSDDIRRTLWKCLPIIALALGKQRFKNRYLDIFLDLLFYDLSSSSSSQLLQHTAGQCLEEISILIGTNMFRARLEDDQCKIYDKIIRERQMMPKGPMGGSDIFSPTIGTPISFMNIVPP